MTAVSKEESMLLIQHAISAYLNEGKSQKELGELLGIEGPRISEGKLGKWKLSSQQRQVIIDNYGYPRREKGQYIKAEVYDTVTEFIDDFEDSSKKRLKRRWYELLMRKDYQDVIISKSRRSSDPFDIRFGSELEPLVFDIALVEKLLSQPETKIWYEHYHSNIGYVLSARRSSEESYFSLVSSVHEDLIDELDSSFEHILFRIAQFKFELMPEFSFFHDAVAPSIPRKELVISGDEVLNFKADCCRVKFNEIADIFGKRDYLKSFLSTSIIPEGTEINDKPDNWKRVILRLYLSESMHYHLWIRLDDTEHLADYTEGYDVEYYAGINDDGLVRNIVIKDLCRMNFLKEIEIIRKWCGWPYDFNDDIKREVAKVGGYVPGAEVL